MLRLAGHINILIAIAHIVGLFWAEAMFEVTGIGNEMRELSRIHPAIPYLITVIVALVFLVFGLYGLSADDNFRRLPFVKPVIFMISGIYLLRGSTELVLDAWMGTNSVTETFYSVVAIGIGLMFLWGALKKWGKPERPATESRSALQD